MHGRERPGEIRKREEGDRSDPAQERECVRHRQYDPYELFRRMAPGAAHGIEFQREIHPQQVHAHRSARQKPHRGCRFGQFQCSVGARQVESDMERQDASDVAGNIFSHFFLL